MKISNKHSQNLNGPTASFNGEDEREKTADAHVEVLRDISKAAVWEYYVIAIVGFVAFILALLHLIFN